MADQRKLAAADEREWATWQETGVPGDDNATFWYDFDEDRGFADEADNRGIQVNLTGEGIIMDAYEDNGMALVGTKAFTYAELFDWLCR